MKKRDFLLFAVAILAITSCSKNTENETVITPYIPTKVGFYILGEGTFGRNDSKLLFFDQTKQTMDYDYIGTNNDGAKVGDTATDIVQYGSKTYIVVNNSQKVMVLNTFTGKILEEIDFDGSNPRYALGKGGKLYVTTWSKGLAVIDTTSLKITKNIELNGGCSEGIAEYGDFLYVANSGNKGDSFGGKGTTISAVSTSEDKEMNTISVPQNPNRLSITKNGDLFVSTWGDYSKAEAQLHRINLKTNELTTIENLAASRFTISNEFIYTYHFSYITYDFSIMKVNLETLVVSEAMSKNMMKEIGLKSIYDICSDPSNGDIYYLDESGKIVVMNKDFTISKQYMGLNVLRINKVNFVNI